MIITREIDYALRVLLTLSDGTRKNVMKISTEACIPEAFTYKITRKLSKQDWITIYRGTDGGCEARKPLSEINLLDVINLIGDKRTISSCVSSDYQCKWKNCNDNICNVNKNLVIMQEKLEEEFRKQSLDILFFN